MEKKSQSIWDELARSQKATRQLAEKAKTLWNRLDQEPQEELVKMFRAICVSGQEYDADLRYRKKILGLIRPEHLPDLIGCRVSISLGWEYERRFWVVEKEPPGPALPGNVDVEEVDDE